ncbi:nSTAND1 domain-containing NTPase [Nocardiopsis trehalosi]|uniref:nSTAND1 domain-containing NTPase n=1 Tax=Nocardiopsis trehalosi TaxID=109329 RepID=UPI00082EAE84|nr:trypsin-like peptidase domain-containing protein [Nocardiopsis trehalosi]
MTAEDTQLMQADGAGAVPGMGADLSRGSWGSASVVQVLAPGGGAAGAGFVAADGLVVTCAHVLPAERAPEDWVRVCFPRLEGAPVVAARVEVVDPAADVAALRLESMPQGAAVVGLGSASGCGGHRVSSYGFPAQAPRRGHFGYGTAGGLLPDGGGGGLLQLTGANDLTTGFSGGPVMDEVTHLVIGMVTAITAPDGHRRGTGIAYATPAEVLREIVPGLAELQVAPYRGLEPFTTGDARWFHGRREVVDAVVDKMRRHRLVLLLGPSGAGKSSLVQAGVVPALADGGLPGSDRWLPVVVRPGRDLVAALEEADLPVTASGGLGPAVDRRLADEPGRDRVVLVVDQFEELLTHRPGTPEGGRRPPSSPSGDAPADAGASTTTTAAAEQTGAERGAAFAEELAAAVEADARLSVVLVMRNDFYPRLAEAHPGLLQAAVPGSVNIPAQLTAAELRAIITRPALDAGARLEDGLCERIIADLRDADPDRRTSATLLPPLQLALAHLWERRTDGRLTHDAYQRIGAVTGSLAAWCNSAVHKLPPSRRPVAQRLLSALVRPADEALGIPATRQQVPLARLAALAAGAPGGREAPGEVFDEVVSALSRDRIIITATRPHSGGRPGEPVAELIHDALLRDWGELREWASRDQRFQVWLHRTTEHARRHAHSGVPADLLAGTALAEALDWARQREMPADITAFLTASRHHEQATVRRSRRLNTVLAGLLSLALVATGLAAWQWQSAVQAQRLAQSRQLAAQSEALAETSPDLASLLAVQAYRLSPTLEARASVFSAADRGLTQRLSGHESPVDGVAISPDGERVAGASTDGTVRLWDTATGQEVHTLKGHDNGVNGVAFSPDGQILASASDDETVRLWDTETGDELRVLRGHEDWVNGVAFSPDGERVVSSGFDGAVRLWDTGTGEEVRTLEGHKGSVLGVAFSRDGERLASGGEDEVVRLWDTGTGREIRALKGHEGPVYGVAFSPDGEWLASAGDDGVVHLWDAGTGDEVDTLNGHGGRPVYGVAFSPDGEWLASAGDDGVVHLWDAGTGDEVDTLKGHAAPVNGVAFSRDGERLASGSDDGTVGVWDTGTGQELTTFKGHVASVYGVAFSRDGERVASAGIDGRVGVWDTGTGQELATFKGHHNPVLGVAFSRDGERLASASADSTVRVWDINTGQGVHTLKGHQNGVNRVAYSPDGQILASASDDWTVRLWDTETGEEVDTLKGHENPVYGVAFSPDGERVVSAGYDWTVRLWDTGAGEEVRTLEGHEGLVLGMAFSWDGEQLASVSDDGTVRVWNTDTGQEIATVNGFGGPVNGVAFSPNGERLAIANDDEQVGVWDTETGLRRLTLIGHEGPVYGVAFSPDGQTLASASKDGTVRLWRVALPNLNEAVNQICQALDRDFTTGERAQYLREIPDSDEPVCPA